MKTIVDASTLINLDNGDALTLATALPGYEFWIAPLALGECNSGCAARIMALVDQGRLHLLDESQLDADRFLELKAEHDLGDGETECLLVAELLEYSVCADDRKARNVAKGLFGDDRVLGSARLMRLLAEEELVDCKRANELFDLMKAAGGYLPNLEHAFFCDDCGH